MKLKFRKIEGRGDTIVEVLISMTVLAVVLGTAYATTNRSFHSGLNSQYRGQAVLIAQKQVEFLKSADGGSSISTFQSPPYRFCIDSITPTPPSTSTTLVKKNLTSSSPTCSWPISGPDAGSSQFTLFDTYTPPPNNPVFTITVQWQSNNLSQNQVVMHYKASGSYVP
jgi:Tfp pilus assembly protein PilV